MAQFWGTLAQAVLGLASAVIATLFTVYGPKVIAIFEKKTNTEWTEQQRQIVLGAVKTAGGIVETAIDQGRMSVLDVHQAGDIVQMQAKTVLAKVPDAAATFNLKPDDVARMIVGSVNTGIRTAVTVSTDVPVAGTESGSPSSRTIAVTGP